MIKRIKKENGNIEIGDIISVVIIALVIIGIIWVLKGCIWGFIDYKPSNDKDKARITAITQEQDFSHTYFRIEVEYLTNTPTQQGVVTNNNIEKDIFYCYYEDEELVKKVQDNLYKEVWIISGHKGGKESYKDFGTKLLKDIRLIEEDK